jgi:hypothetical protein
MYFPTNLKTRNSKKAYSGIQINFPLAAAITVSKKGVCLLLNNKKISVSSFFMEEIMSIEQD